MGTMLRMIPWRRRIRRSTYVSCDETSHSQLVVVMMFMVHVIVVVANWYFEKIKSPFRDA